MKSSKDFEKALSELEDIVKKLESGNVGLNESIELYEKGIFLSDLCSNILENAKQRVSVIKNDNYKESEFDSKDNPEDNDGI